MGGVYLCPCLDYWEDFGGAKVGESEVVRGRECDHVAFPCDRICA